MVTYTPKSPVPQTTPEGRRKWACKYRFYSEFQSHEPEFDYLKSLEIEEKINQIKWCRRTGGAHFLLSSNGASFSGLGWCMSRGWVDPNPRPDPTPTHSPKTDKTIKLWKVHERKVREAAPHPGELPPAPSPIRRGFSGAMLSLIREELEQPPEARAATLGAPATGSGSGGGPILRIPQYRTSGSVATATLKRSFANAHAYHVNSLSVNADGQTFISADDLRINLWSLECNNQSFSTCAQMDASVSQPVKPHASLSLPTSP